jgi:hypothetical protein
MQRPPEDRLCAGHRVHLAQHDMSDGRHGSPHLVVVRHGEIGLVDLDVLAAGSDQQAEIVAQQLADVDRLGNGPAARRCRRVGCTAIGRGRVSPLNAGILCQKQFNMALGGECLLCVRRCLSPPVMTSMPASSCSRMAACVARSWASAKSADESWPRVTFLSKASYHRGTP